MSDTVFVTGVGIVSPAGADTESTWRAMVAGTPCVAQLNEPEITGGGAVCAGRVPGFVPPDGLAGADRVCQLAVSAADQAWAAAGLNGAIGHGLKPERTAVSFGTSKGGIMAFATLATSLHEAIRAAVQRVTPTTGIKKHKAVVTSHTFFKEVDLLGGIHYLSPSLYSTNYQSVPSYELRNTLLNGEYLLKALADIPPDAAARTLALRYGITGGAHASVAACATGSLAVIRAVQMIRDGQADVVIAGAADASLHPLWFAAFQRMGVLAGPHPQLGAGWACRPFDRDRRGFAIAEGAAALVIESRESVERRGIQPLAGISGYAMGTDPAGLATVDPDGAALARIVQIAGRRGGIDLGRVAAVQAHGTGTPANDLAEINGLRACGLCHEQVPIVSFKGSLGHLLGAAGAVELAISVLALRHGVMPGNATLLDPDPESHPAWLPRKAITLKPGPVIKTSLGFGGHLAAAVLESVCPVRPDGTVRE